MTAHKPPCIVCGGEGCATACKPPRLNMTDVDAALWRLEDECDQMRRERDAARSERDKACVTIFRLRRTLEEMGCRPIESGDCAGCKALARGSTEGS